MAISTRPPSGMRDFLSGELAKRKLVIATIEKVYEKYGFVPIETPAIENLSTLLGKYGDEGDQLLFRILHRRDKLARALEKEDVSEKNLADTGLRYDLTVPLARVMANYGDLPRFFKRYQIQPVWRADRPGKGRFREFLQCDVDITGTGSLLAEAEVCSAVAEVFKALKFDNFKIHINHRQLLKCLIKAAGIETENESTTLVAVDKLDKIGIDGVKKELHDRGITQQQSESLLQLIQRPESLSEEQELQRLKEKLADTAQAESYIRELETLLNLLNQTEAADRVFIDASLARGLGYYTGSIFEIRSSELGSSLGGGGRYDELIGMFKGRQIPAVGFSIGFERLVMILEEKGFFGDLTAGPDLMLCHFKDVADAEVLRVANIFRSSGLKVEVYPEASKIGKQISYAESVNAGWAAILGAAEVAEQKIKVKNLKTGDQQNLTYEQAATFSKSPPKKLM
ncbi:MAG: histidine--tRNA ligase [Candidatus Rifleibacteriota bacterium]